MILKLMLSAVIVGMIGFHLMTHFGFVQSHAAEGSIGSNVIGGLSLESGLPCLDIARERLPARGERERSMPFLEEWSALIGAGIFAERHVF